MADLALETSLRPNTPARPAGIRLLLTRLALQNLGRRTARTVLLLMAVAIRCKTFKEAQANATLVVLVTSLLPLVSLFNLGGEAPWYVWVPALAQNALMTRVLKGEDFGPAEVLIPISVCAVLAGAGIWFVARMLRQAALK